MKRKRRCVECRYCDLRIDFDSGSHYFCHARREPLPYDVVTRPACGRYRRPLPWRHWGP